MNARPLRVGAAIALGLVVLFVPRVDAYDRYSIDDDNTNCRACHGDFRSNSYISLSDGMNWGNLHNLHRFDMLNGDCNACHTSPGETPVFTDESGGGIGFAPISCMGCHGREQDMGNDSISDGRGAGLRQHHVNAGVKLCGDCHSDALPAGRGPAH